MQEKFYQGITRYLKRGRRRLLAIGLFLACMGYIVWTTRTVQPAFQDKPLTYWLEHYIPPPTNSPSSGGFVIPDPDAVEAIRQMGTNAIPALLDLMRAQDSPAKLELLALVKKQRVVPVRFSYSWDKNQWAQRGFGVLGSAASNAVPSLIEILNSNLSPSSQKAAVIALATIGPPARQSVPSLVRMLADGNSSMRYNAIRAIGEIHAEPQLAVPALIKCLNDPHPDIRQGGAEALARFGTNAEPAIPALIEVCERNSDASSCAVMALGFIGPAACKVVPVLLRGLADTNRDSEFRFQCIQALGRIHAEPDLVVPALVKTITETSHDDDGRFRYFSTEALGRYGPDAGPAIPTLMNLFRDTHVNVRAAATNALKAIEPSAIVP